VSTTIAHAQPMYRLGAAWKKMIGLFQGKRIGSTSRGRTALQLSLTPALRNELAFVEVNNHNVDLTNVVL